MEQIIGTILYAAESPSYAPRTIVFTDSQVLRIPISKIGELANRASAIPVVAAWLAGANPSAFMGIGGLVGLKKWGDLKKQVADKSVVSLEKGDLTDDIQAAAVSKLPYEKIKEVKVKKVMMSSDWYMHIGAGFVQSANISFDGRAADDVKNLIKSTPLAPKLKE